MLSEKQLKKILLKEEILDEDELKKIEKETKGAKIPIEKFLVERKIISEDLLYETLASFYKVSFISLKDRHIRQDVLTLISEPIAETHEIIPFEKEEKKLKIATLDPLDLETLEFIKKKTGLEIEIYLTTPSSLKAVLKQYHKTLEAEFKEITKTEEPLRILGGKKPLRELAQDLPIIRIVNTLLEYAIFEGASDIHIEPAEKEVIVRYRIDGILQEVMRLPKSAQAGIIARIKILANLKIDEHRLPQDGRFKVETSEYKVSLRVSVISVFDGEKIVLRLLREEGVLNLEELGLASRSFKIVQQNIKRPHGMILVTGPTGSGKTTTLYAILSILNTPEVNISTIEDPVEYRMPRINQSQVNPKIGFTFAHGLRALMRQDPDIIMVGEIRDQETEEIAIHAALTGHLVLSTLHTNDAAGALPRLLDMGAEPFLVASTTNLIIAQRLLRKICRHCIESFNLDEESIKELEEEFDIESILKGLFKEGALAKKQKSLSSVLFFKGKGCKRCGGSGYKGRTGIYEIFEVNEKIRELVLRRASSDEIGRVAREQGMLTMAQDGFIKAKNGITTIEEVFRVSRE